MSSSPFAAAVFLILFGVCVFYIAGQLAGSAHEVINLLASLEGSDAANSVTNRL